ncbi:2-oxo acid dehydrogenase subunit E2 [Spiractinospora alimapuensis]|uniref:dihydrolipoamide acetyltransferase family protein n=1 Tax=Spiractinospora alimapuensis TaxID=2820884 RepID=UPI001F362E08|nr:dihydrolipoamide acetyltransferase family protein [Spiractinospora alimapuensis]QVQ52025.1 2-oxo acid dehydrogenase subunit E2 [Spiractinospora alimapuensis]
MTGRDFALPDLGEGLTEAEILRWLVDEGDAVAVDAPVVEVETAKTSVVVPCPYAGTVTRLHAPAGTVVPVGSPLITITEDAATSSSDTDDEEGSGPVLVGYGTRRRTGSTAGRGDVPVQASRVPVVPSDGHGPSTTVATGRVAVVSPLVRRIAREHGIDATTLAGTGEGGLVLRRDVEAAIAARVGAVNGASSAPGPDARTVDEAVHRIPLRGARRTMAEHLARSRQEIPEATVWVDVDATEFLATRAAINAAAPDHPVSVLGLLARICVAGLRRYPVLNATVDTSGGEILRHEGIHLGVATHTEHGLVVPVVRDAGTMTTRDLSHAVADTVSAARARELPPDRYRGGTFTVNNYGVFGVDGSAPIINHPEAAMVGMGRITRRPWIVETGEGEQVVPRSVTTLTLVFDHRVCDGGVAGGFLRFVADHMENPRALLGEF